MHLRRSFTWQDGNGQKQIFSILSVKDRLNYFSYQLCTVSQEFFSASGIALNIFQQKKEMCFINIMNGDEKKPSK